MSKLSVIIPVYNAETYLEECLDSIIGQTFTDMEIILIDDGSTDSSGIICDEYAKKDNRIKVMHKENNGVSAARNDGIERSQGEWIAFVDADDWCDKDYFEKMFCKMGKQNVDVFLGGGRYIEYGSRKSVVSNKLGDFHYRGRKRMDFLMAKALAPKCGSKDDRCHGIGVPWDKFYRTDFIKRNRLFFDDELKAANDVFFNFQVFDAAGRVAGCSCIGYHYRQVATSIVHGYNPDKEKIFDRFLAKIYAYLSGREISEIMQKAIYARSLVFIINLLMCDLFHEKNNELYRKKVKRIREIKKKPYYSAAIWCEHNELLIKKQKIGQMLLRLPWIWPMYAAIVIRRKL